jgi:hypothetical protein
VSDGVNTTISPVELSLSLICPIICLFSGKGLIIRAKAINSEKSLILVGLQADKEDKNIIEVH